MVQNGFQTRAQTNLLKNFFRQQDGVFKPNVGRIPLKRDGFDDIMECTAQEVTYIVKVVVDGLSFTDKITGHDDDTWMWEGIDILVNAYLFISEDETPDIKAKNMKVRPQMGDKITGQTIRSWH